MRTEEIKKIVDDERTEQLTVQVCRHWQVAADRLECLVQELADGMDTCVEAEVYAAIMRMQSTMTALVELNKMPCAFLYSEYLDRIDKMVCNNSLRKSVITLTSNYLGEPLAHKSVSFVDLSQQMMNQYFAMPPQEAKNAQPESSPLQYFMYVCAQHLKPEDLIVMATIVNSINEKDASQDKDLATAYFKTLHQAMDSIGTGLTNNMQVMVLWLLVLMLLPGMLVSIMKSNRSKGKAMANLLDKELARVRKSNTWEAYWKEYRDTLRVVNDSCSWLEVMTAERSKELQELAQVPGGLFAKWTADREAFDRDFQETQLSDEQIRYFIFHLASLCEVARELDPTTKFGQEQLVNTDVQQIGEAVINAANKLANLLDEKWMPHYINMWRELIEDENIFAHLKVTRKSPHNNQFTARFFCHLVGEMKKSAMFGAHSDRDLAQKLTEVRYVDTFRKNIQEGFSSEDEKLKKVFSAIYQKYNQLANSKNNCTIS